jgi:hypothetical protein
MPNSNPDDALLLIRCPSCGQRFKVGEDLRGRTVECGGCEHRFRINDDVIVRGKKFYPGERKNSALNRFQRVPLSIAPATTAVPGVQYLDAPDPIRFEPTSPQRIVAGVVGVAGMVLMALLLMFGASRGGMLDGMITMNRLLMAGFTGLLGIVMLVYANPRARAKAFMVGLLMSAGLISLPFFFTVGSIPLSELSAVPPVAVEEKPKQSAAGKTMTELGNLIGTRPLDDEIARLASEGSSKHAVGLWLRDLREHNRILIRDYIERVTGAEAPPHYYPRNKGDFLMVVSGTSASLEEVAKAASALGSVEKVHTELSVVEVKVNNESFVEGPIEKLNDRKDPAFYDLNKRELESIDLMRVSKAVKRLAEAEPKVYRSDINRKLIALLGARWVDFKGDVCNALSVWAEKPGPAGDAALIVANELVSSKSEVPPEMIALIVKEKNSGVIPILDELWSKNPTHWESLYGDVGNEAEATLIRRVGAADGALRQSIVRLLGRVGGADSLPVLEAARAGADSELRVLIEKSTAAIRGRIGS